MVTIIEQAIKKVHIIAYPLVVAPFYGLGGQVIEITYDNNLHLYFQRHP
ncbi:MAG: hypothetical protein ACTS73_04685 [Arsenophonus sp. NEOnobi-MAG3]